MTHPGPNLAPPAANPNVNIPPDQQSRFGWTHPHRDPITGRHWDLHKLGSVGMILLESAAATAILSATDGDFLLTYNWTSSTETTTHTSHSRIVDGGQQTEVIPHITTTSVPGKPKTRTYSASAANMPDVTSFNLNTTPEAQVIIKEADFGGFLDGIAGSVRDGYHITSLSIDGVASDETRLDAKAGLGERDPKNLGLAKQYQDFVKVATVRGLQKRGVKVDPAVEHGHPSEAVLDGDTLASVEGDRIAGHFKTNLDLINAWKENPDSLDDSTRSLLDEVLADVRGANISIRLETPAGTIIHKTYETIDKRCLSTTTTYVTTSTRHGHKGHDIPITIIPIPIVRGRRERRRRGAVPALSSTGAAPNAASTAITGGTTPTRGGVVNPVPGPGGTGHRPAAGSPRTAVHRPVRPAAQEVGRVRRIPPQLKKYGALAVTGLLSAGGLLFVASIRGDAGYCPDVRDHAKQDFRWNDGLDYLGVRLRIPFTDVQTGEGILVGSDIDAYSCPPKGANPNTPTYVPLPAPTCDVRTITIVNGDTKHKKVTETHYPGAITPGTPKRIK